MSIRGDIARLQERHQVYFRLCGTMLFHPRDFIDAVKSRWPFCFPDPKYPRIVGLEFTNACNLRCPYCASQTPLVRGPVGFMTEDTLNNIVEALVAFPLHTLRVIGGGEPTAHPQFAKYASSMKGIARLTTLTTNGQLLSEETAYAVAKTFDIIEISVEGSNPSEYERYRVGASFTKLEEGIRRLKRASPKVKGPLLHLRVMIKPSDRPRLNQIRTFWGQFTGTVSLQPIFDRIGGVPDSIVNQCRSDKFHRCEHPFKAMAICWNGDVPLCDQIEERLRVSDGGILLGSTKHSTVLEIWNGAVARQYRLAHRMVEWTNAPLCIGCDEYWGTHELERASIAQITTSFE